MLILPPPPAVTGLSGLSGLSLAGGAAATNYLTRYGAVANYPLDEASATQNALAAIGGLDLTRTGAPPVAAGVVAGARSCNAVGSQSFSHVDDPVFRIGAFDWAIGFWANVDAGEIGAARALVSKDGGTAGWHFRLQADGTVLFIVRQTGGADFARKASAVAITGGAWYFVFAYIDVAAPEVGISLNGGAFQTAAGTGTPGPGAAAFTVGATNGDAGVRALFDEVSVFNPPAPGIGSLKTEMRDRLYNSGAGRPQPYS